MEIGGVLPDLEPKGRPSLSTSYATRSVQRPALNPGSRSPLTHDTQPLAALRCRIEQSQRWLEAGVFNAIMQGRRTVLRLAQGHKEQPPATIKVGRKLQPSLQSDGSARYGGGKRKRGSLRLRQRQAVYGYLCISPWVLGFIFFTLGPMLYSL